MVAYLKDTRVKCKHGGDIDVIKGVPNKIAAEALKIVINSIYGKLGSELFFLYDRFAQLQVTINGQLMTMTLVEELELNGIHVISANTDGIVIKLPRDKFNVYKDITDRWNEFNKMGADYEEYDRIISRDINNYFDIQTTGDIEYKGALDPKQYIKNLSKGYDMPIVAKAVFEYFANNVPVMETLHKHTDILDFCLFKACSIGSFTLPSKCVTLQLVKVRCVISRKPEIHIVFFRNEYMKSSRSKQLLDGGLNGHHRFSGKKCKGIPR
jgi:hypothetical protein